MGTKQTEKETAICRICGKEKDKSEFRTDRRTKIGAILQCKSCRNKRERANGTYLRNNFRLLNQENKRLNDTHLLSFDEYRKIVSRDTCPYCGIKRTDDVTFTVDHVVPRMRGLHVAHNLTYCCKSCNSSKGNDSLLDFKARSDKFTDKLLNEFIREQAELHGVSEQYLREYLDADQNFTAREAVT